MKFYQCCASKESKHLHNISISEWTLNGRKRNHIQTFLGAIKYVESIKLSTDAKNLLRTNLIEIIFLDFKCSNLLFQRDLFPGPIISASMFSRSMERNQGFIEYVIWLPSDWGLGKNWSAQLCTNLTASFSLPTQKLQSNIFKLKISLRFEDVMPGDVIDVVVLICTISLTDPRKYCYDIFERHLIITQGKSFYFDFDLTLPYLIFAQKNEAESSIIINSMNKIEVELFVKILEFSCIFWNESLNEWDDSGCWVLNVADNNISKLSAMTCKCSHLSVFTGIVRNKPIPINFSISFQKLLANPSSNHTIFTLLIMWAIYALLAIWASLQDRVDTFQAMPIDLSDNFPHARNVYIMVVYTGKLPSAGTKAHVFVQLVGTRRKSDPHRLSCSKFDVLKRAQRNVFIVRTFSNLGDLTNLRIWLCGSVDSWYLRYVEVVDLQMMRIFHFVCESWLSLDLLSYKTIQVANYYDLYAFKPLMSFNVCRAFEEWHNWLSVFFLPVGDNFSRFQRLSRSFCLLLGNLMCTLMFFGTPNYYYEIFGFGTIRVTYTNITIAIFNSILLSPLIAIISYLFRFSQRKTPSQLVIADWKISEESKVSKSLMQTVKSFGTSINTTNSSKSNDEKTQQDSNHKREIFKKFKINIKKKVTGENVATQIKQREQQKFKFDLKSSLHSLSGRKYLIDANADQSGTLQKKDEIAQINQVEPSDNVLPLFETHESLQKTPRNQGSFVRGRWSFIRRILRREDTPKKESQRPLLGMYVDQYPLYHKGWTLHMAWVITVVFCLLFTFIVSLYTVMLPWQSYKSWVIASSTSFLLFFLVKDPAAVIFFAFIYSSIFKERLGCPIFHLKEIKEETVLNLKKITRKELLDIRNKRLHEFYKPNKWTELYQQKLIKRLEWDGGYKQFIIETVFYMYLVTVFFTMSLLLYNPLVVYSNLHYERTLGSYPKKMEVIQDFWLWTSNSLVPVTYHKGKDHYFFEPGIRINYDPVIIKAPCMHTVKRDVETWSFFIDHFGLFDSSTICLTTHLNHSVKALHQLATFQYLTPKFEGMGCSTFLYSSSLDILTNIFASLKLPVGGGVKFSLKVTSVELHLETSDSFALFSLAFLVSALFSMAHIIQKMTLFGFGNYFCNLWNIIFLMMILLCLGMSITWWIFLKQWKGSRERMMSNEDFDFDEFYQMNQLLSFPSAIFMTLYSWRLLYFVCTNDRLNSFFVVVGRSTLQIVVLTFHLCIPAGIITSSQIVGLHNESAAKRVCRAIIYFGGRRTLTVNTIKSAGVYLILYLWLHAFVTLWLHKIFCTSIVVQHFKRIKVLPVEKTRQQKYLLLLLAKIFQGSAREEDFRQEYINTATRRKRRPQLQKH